MSKEKPQKNHQEYEVGYGKPPQSKRFKTGTSGNPKGRPKGKKSRHNSADTHAMMALFFAESDRKVAVTENNTVKNISMAQAVIRSLAVKAATGDHRAQKLYLDYSVRFSEEKQKQRDEFKEVAIQYKIHWENKIHQAKKAGISIDMPVPHPDQIVVLRNGEVTIQGPTTIQENNLVDEYQMKLRELEKLSAEMLKYSKKDWEKTEYKLAVAKFVAVGKEACKLEERLKGMFQI
jgi:hypothetical protein